MNQSEPMNQSKKMYKIPSLFDVLDDSHLYLHPKNEKCVFNQYGQCIKGFRYFCAYCNYGVGGIYSLLVTILLLLGGIVLVPKVSKLLLIPLLTWLMFALLLNIFEVQLIK